MAQRFGTPNTQLTRLSLARRNMMSGQFGFQAEQVCPTLNNGLIRGTYVSWDKGDFFQNPQNVKTDRDIGREIDVSGTVASYETVRYGSHARYTDRELADFAQGGGNMALAAQLRDAKTLAVTEADMIAHEVRVMTLVGTAGSYTNKTTLTNTWADKINGTPLDDIETGKNTVHSSIFRKPTDMLIGWQTWSNLRRHPQVVAELNAANLSAGPAQVQVAQVSEMIGLDIHVSGAGYATSGLQARDSSTLGYIWSDKALIYYKNDSPNIYDYTLARTFAYKDFQFRLYRDLKTGVWYPINEHDVVSILTAELAGYLISNTDA